MNQMSHNSRTATIAVLLPVIGVVLDLVLFYLSMKFDVTLSRWQSGLPIFSQKLLLALTMVVVAGPVIVGALLSLRILFTPTADKTSRSRGIAIIGLLANGISICFLIYCFWLLTNVTGH